MLPFLGLSMMPRRSCRNCWARIQGRLRATCSTAGRSVWLVTLTFHAAAGSMRRPRRSSRSNSRPTTPGSWPPNPVLLVLERARRSRALVAEPFLTGVKRIECERLLGCGAASEPLLMRFRGRARPVSFIDDVAVPPEQLATVLPRLQGLFQQQNVNWTVDAYAGEGRLRLRPFLDLADPGDRAKLEPLANRVYDIVIEAGGTVSSARGCGLARTQFLRRQYGELVQVFREIKDAFDPQNQLNPGKVIGDDPHLMLQNLKPWLAPPAPPPADPPSSLFSWHGPARREPGGSGEFKSEAKQHATATLGVETANIEAEDRSTRSTCR